MARITGPGPVCRICRREGLKLFLKGSRCYSKKCSFERRPTPPGQHGVRRRKVGDYGLQLREKQKVRRIYRILERQFRGYFEVAESRPGVTGENLLRLLELRLDNVIYRLGFGASRRQARQLVRHGHFTVNGRRVNIPSFRVKTDDVITAILDSEGLKAVVEDSTDLTASVPAWLQADHDNMVGKVLRQPERVDIDIPIQESLIVELYSK